MTTPYLQRPLRTLEEAQRQRCERLTEAALRRAMNKLCRFDFTEAQAIKEMEIPE